MMRSAERQTIVSIALTKHKNDYVQDCGMQLVYNATKCEYKMCLRVNAIVQTLIKTEYCPVVTFWIFYPSFLASYPSFLSSYPSYPSFPSFLPSYPSYSSYPSYPSCLFFL